MADHFKKNVVRSAIGAGVHTTFQAVQGQDPVKALWSTMKVAVQQTVASTLQATGSNIIGNAYGSGTINPIAHKLLHGGLGGLSGAILNGEDGAVAGFSSAMIAETLADMLRPQLENVAREAVVYSDSEEAYDAFMDDYLLQQKNIILLTTSSIMAGFGQDVDTAISVADTALIHNNLGIGKAIVELVKAGAKAASQFGKGVWDMGPVIRGEVIEKMLGQNLHKNFPTVDKFKDGVVTSIKSIDLKAATYQNTTKLSHKLRKYVDKVAKFNGGAVNIENQILSNQIKGRALEIAIPRGASAAQKQVMKEVVDYGLTKNVTVNIIKIK